MPGSSPDQGTTISIPDPKATDSKIQPGHPGGQTLKLTSGGFQLNSLAPGQPILLAPGPQLVPSNGAPQQPSQILTNGNTALNMTTNGNTALNLTAHGNTQAINMTTGGKLIQASHVSTPRIIVPAGINQSDH